MNERIELKPLSFEEAIAFFRGKVVLSPGEWSALKEEVRAKAFTVANVATLDIIQNIYDELLEAVKKGGTAKEFRARVNTYIEDKGYTGLSAYRTDNIFRTNIQTAYNAGRCHQQTRAAKSRPIWIYSAVDDARTRPAHRALHGVARRWDDPFWDTWYPPNGYRCRCSVRTASLREAERDDITVETGEAPAARQTPDGQVVCITPDIGFATNPAKAAWQPDMGQYEPELAAQYETKRNGL